MPEPQLSVRSARARDLAHMLAKRERRPVARVVEQALEAYANQTLPRSLSGRELIERLRQLPRRENEPDVDLAVIAREGRKPHRGIDIE
jgi:hypothetical protein